MENSTLKKNKNLKTRRNIFLNKNVGKKLLDEILESHKLNKIIKGFVLKSEKRGFFILTKGDLSAFLPGSETGFENPKDFNQYIGKNLDFRIDQIINDKLGLTIVLSRIGVE